MEERHRTVGTDDVPKAPEEDNGERLERCLDEALENTFPASDPINVIQPAPRSTDKLSIAGGGNKCRKRPETPPSPSAHIRPSGLSIFLRESGMQVPSRPHPRRL